MSCPEVLYSRALTGQQVPSVLMTDAYKFSMAQAGFPLRQETFYLALRTGGPHYLPFNFAEVARTLLVDMSWGPGEKEWFQRDTNQYQCTSAMLAALDDHRVEVWSPPAGAWVADGEPILTVTGPSFKASWLEPLAIMFRFPIQVATAILKGTTTEFQATCDNEATIIRLVASHLNVEVQVTTDPIKYLVAVGANADAIRKALDGDMNPAFEVGLRAATCVQQHLFALEVLRLHGFGKSSHLFGATRMAFLAVGTTGHEHQQRWLSDGAGYRAMRDMRTAPPSYLFDTFDALRGGIQTAIEVMREDLNVRGAVRFDSGDTEQQLRLFRVAEELHGIAPKYIFEDSYTADKTTATLDLCKTYNIGRRWLSFGYGGFLINPVGAVQFRRDDVSAVYKLSKTGTVPVMKTCGSKSSLPGVPRILVRDDGSRLIAQDFETYPDARPLRAEDPAPPANVQSLRSEPTASFIIECRNRIPLNLAPIAPFRGSTPARLP